MAEQGRTAKSRSLHVQKILLAAKGSNILFMLRTALGACTVLSHTISLVLHVLLGFACLFFYNARSLLSHDIVGSKQSQTSKA